MCLKLKLFLLLLVLLCFSFSAYSQDVAEMTDNELLTELTTILTDLESDNQILQTNLTEAMQELTGLRTIYSEVKKLSIIQQQELDELKTLYKSYEKEQAIKIVQSVIVSGLIGAVVGGATVLIVQ